MDKKLEAINAALDKWGDGKGGPRKFESEDDFLIWWEDSGSQRCSMCHLVENDCKSCPVHDCAVFKQDIQIDRSLETYFDRGACCIPWDRLDGVASTLHMDWLVPLEEINKEMSNMYNLLIGLRKELLDAEKNGDNGTKVQGRWWRVV